MAGAGERLDLAADADWGVARVFSVARVDGNEVMYSCRCPFLLFPLKESADIISKLAAFVTEKERFLKDRGCDCRLLT